MKCILHNIEWLKERKEKLELLQKLYSLHTKLLVIRNNSLLSNSSSSITQYTGCPKKKYSGLIQSNFKTSEAIKLR